MIRVAHYINQFFAGVGGEDKAGHPFEVREGAVGPGRILQTLLGSDATITHTLVCGDNAFHEDPDANLAAILAALESIRPDLLVAGPGFNAGRYGLACGAICSAATERLGIPAVTGLFPEAPAVDVYRSRIVMVPTGNSAAGMQDAMSGIARVGMRLARGEGLLPADEDGRIPKGYRANWPSPERAATRAVRMLVQRLGGEEVHTEVALPKQAEVVPPAPAVTNLAAATIALVTEGGLVPRGNPDRIESSSATRWARYPVEMLAENGGAGFASIHAGYDSQWVDADPDRMVPLDALRALAAEGVIGAVHPYFYVTTGTGTTVTHGERIGQEIAEQLIADGVAAVIVTST